MSYLLFLSFSILFYMHFETRLLFKSNIAVGNPDKNAVTLKIAHLSDLHIGKMFVSKKLIRNSILKNSPDCIVLTGDYIEKKSHINKFMKFIDYVNPCKLPIIMVWGNHDHKLFREDSILREFGQILYKNGITVLENENKVIKKGKKSWCFVGVDDLFYGKPDVEKAFLETEKADFKVVLTHNPDMLFKILEKDFDILLCGHFHGGQIYMPFDLEYKFLRNEKLAKMRITQGIKDVLGHKIYINRGLGNVLLPFRFLSPPEIAFIEIG